MYHNFFKRLLDSLISLIAISLLGPIILVVALWLYFANKGAGILFTQLRPGKNARTFKIYKFKTMTDERDEKGDLLHDKYRLTKAGKFIRATSLDELPQLINVLKGEMSLVLPAAFTAQIPSIVQRASGTPP